MTASGSSLRGSSPQPTSRDTALNHAVPPTKRRDTMKTIVQDTYSSPAIVDLRDIDTPVIGGCARGAGSLQGANRPAPRRQDAAPSRRHRTVASVGKGVWQ